MKLWDSFLQKYLLKLIIDGAALVLLPPGRGQRDGGRVRELQRDAVLLVPDHARLHRQHRGRGRNPLLEPALPRGRLGHRLPHPHERQVVDSKIGII